MTVLPAALFQFNIWSFAVSAAIVSGYAWVLYRAGPAGLSKPELESAMVRAIIAGLVVSHMVEVVFYRPGLLRTEGVLTLFKFWEGLSSYGGFAGGLGAMSIFYLRRRGRWWREADLLIQGMIVAWIFGRFGCTVAGDHPGPRTDFIFAYRYPDGARHNLGLYEFLYTLLVLFPANLILGKRKPPPGSFVALNCLLYGAARFALDFLRATDIREADPRYFGLTLAHYCSLATFLFGLWVLIQTIRGRLDSDPVRPPPPPLQG
jgi:phosphatidylglycerol:prolipoprotein diacylglycerol transferase